MVTFSKRQKERERQQKQKEKLVRREQRKQEKAARPNRSELATDPDIAHIVPGPQPALED